MRNVWAVLFLAMIALLAFAPGFFNAEPPADDELVVIAPHWDGIKYEFGRGFQEYYRAKTQRTIRVTWMEVGATGEIRKYLTERLGQVGPHEGVGIDILFGGGVDMLPAFAERGLFEPYPLNERQLKELPAANFGQDLRDPAFRFHGACLASFGFVVNTMVLERAKLPEPATWRDLARPEFQGWVSCGNPAQSGSLHAAFEMILQGHGWDEGWSILACMCANVRAFNEGGSSIPRDVSLGQAAAGPCIDFYATAPIRRQGADHLKLVVPKGLAVATPDGLALLRHAPNRAAALLFMEFVLGEEGQRLWYQSRGTPGGPQRYDLERLPVMPRIYEMNLPTHTVLNPFKDAPQFSYDSRKAGLRWNTMDDLWRALLIDPHSELWDARKAVAASGRGDLAAALTRAPFDEAAARRVAQARLSFDARNELRNRWSAWARTWYAAVESAARNNGAVPAFAPAPEQ